MHTLQAEVEEYKLQTIELERQLFVAKQNLVTAQENRQLEEQTREPLPAPVDTAKFEELEEKLRLRALAVDNALRLQEIADHKREEMEERLETERQQRLFVISKVKELVNEISEENDEADAQPAVFAGQPYYSVYGGNGRTQENTYGVSISLPHMPQSLQPLQTQQPQEGPDFMDLVNFQPMHGYEGRPSFCDYSAFVRKVK